MPELPDFTVPGLMDLQNPKQDAIVLPFPISTLRDTVIDPLPSSTYLIRFVDDLAVVRDEAETVGTTHTVTKSLAKHLHCTGHLIFIEFFEDGGTTPLVRRPVEFEVHAIS